MRGARSIEGAPATFVPEAIPSGPREMVDIEVTRLLAAIFHALAYPGIGYRMAIVPAAELLKRLEILSQGWQAPDR